MRFNSKLLRTFLIGAGAAAIAMLWTGPAAAQGGRKPTWDPELHLKNTAEITTRLHAPVLEGSNRLHLTNGKESRQVTNCEEYLNAVGTGFHPVSNYDVKTSGDFVYECFALRDLQHAHDAVSTSNYHWTPSSLTHLPPVLVPGAGDVSAAVDQAEKHGQSWKQFDPSLKITKISGDLMLAEDSNYLYSLAIIARGDFNGDGVEDVMVYGTAQGKNSTWAHPEYFIFSPSNNNGKLTRLTHSHAPYRMKVKIPD